jgi:hypothetical protein
MVVQHGRLNRFERQREDERGRGLRGEATPCSSLPAHRAGSLCAGTQRAGHLLLAPAYTCRCHPSFPSCFLSTHHPPPACSLLYSRAPRGGVTRQGVVVTDLTRTDHSPRICIPAPACLILSSFGMPRLVSKIHRFINCHMSEHVRCVNRTCVCVCVHVCMCVCACVP